MRRQEWHGSLMHGTRRSSITRWGLPIALLACCGPAAGQSGVTLHVPWDHPSVQAAHDAASSGDTILVAPGTWSGPVTITKAVTLASYYLATGSVSFIGTTVLDGGGGDFVISIPPGAEHGATIQGLTIQNAGDGISAHAVFDLLDCRVWLTSDGVDYESGSGGLVRRCLLEVNSDDGLDLDGSVGLVVEDSLIRDNGDDGVEIRMHFYTGPTLQIVLRDNAIYRNGEDGIQLIHYDVLTDRSFEFSGNLVFENLFVGLGMMDGGDTIEDFRAADIPEPIHVFGNSFVGNGHGITGGDNTVVVNNLFVNHPAIAVKEVDAGSTLAYNLYFDNGTDHSGSNVDIGSSLYADPLLTPAFAPASGSPAIDAGTARFTWQGATVLDLPASAYAGAAPDMGAIEFGSLPDMLFHAPLPPGGTPPGTPPWPGASPSAGAETEPDPDDG